MFLSIYIYGTVLFLLSSHALPALPRKNPHEADSSADQSLGGQSSADFSKPVEVASIDVKDDVSQPRKWTNVPKKGAIFKGHFIFQAQLSRGHVSFREVSGIKCLFPQKCSWSKKGRMKLHKKPEVAKQKETTTSPSNFKVDRNFFRWKSFFL